MRHQARLPAFAPHFAIASDLVLRRLKRLCPRSRSGAYADDLATVFEDWLKDLKVISKLFAEYALISGLELNWKKVVVVPLDLADVETWRNEAAAQNAQWAAAQYGRSAKYLGFILGPGRDEKSWTGPLEKLQSRAKEWGQIGGGLLLTTLAYAVYMLSLIHI